MNKYIFLYSGGPGMPKDPVEAKAGMDAWMAYYGKIQASLADGGAPLVPGGELLGGASASGVTGFTIVHAEDMAKALALTEGHPYLTRGGHIEVRECVDVSTMK